MLTDQQLTNMVEEYARNKVGNKVQVGSEEPGHAPSYVSFVEDYRKLKLLAAMVNAKVEGFQTYVKDTLVPNLNLAYDTIETEVGLERLSNPKTNYIQNGGFRLWNAAVNLPLGWTAAGAPTITRTTGRTLPPVTTQGGNYAVTIAAGGAAGSISRTFRVKGGSIYRVAGWLNLTGTATATITLTDNGGTPTVVAIAIPAAKVGAGAWFSFPRVGWDVVAIQTATDATQVTVKLEVDANKTCAFSDFQGVQGPNADADMWEPAPEDIEAITGMGTLPGGYGSSGQVLGTDGAGATSWTTPTALPTFVDNEVPSGTINGINTIFVLAHTPSPSTSLHLYQNGLRKKAGGVDFTLAAQQITFAAAPIAGDLLLADYRY